MITSQKELQRELSKEMSSLSDADVFFSEAYKNMLKEMQQGILKDNIEGNVYVEKSNPEEVAWTDGFDVHINYDFKDLKKLDKGEKHLFILGSALHEYGHKLFTDFRLLNQAITNLERGSLYPMPKGNKWLEETIKALNSGDFKLTTAMIDIYRKSDNIIEDAYVNKAISCMCPGYGYCLKYNYKVTSAESFETLEEMRKTSPSEVELLLNLIFFYCVYGKYGCDIDSSMDDDVINAFKQILPYLNDAIYEASPMKRTQLKNDVFCCLFHFIKEQTKKNEDKKKENDEKSKDNSSTSKKKENDSAEKEKNDDSSPSEKEKKPDSSENKEKSDEKESLGSSSSEPSPTGLANAMTEAAKNMSTSEKSSHKGNNGANLDAVNAANKALNTEKNTEEKENVSAEINKEALNDQVEQIKKEAAMDKIAEKQEKELKADYNSNVQNVDYNGLHKNYIPSFTRSKFSEGARREYEKNHSELDVTVRRFMKEFEKELKDMQLGDNLTGLYAGKQMDTHHLYREDKRIFSQKLLPQDVPDMAVGILVDCSGSMWGEKIESAKKCAYITYMFCKKLNIPVFIVGHDATGRTIRLNCVADERSLDDNDKYRIFDLCALSANRDGYALRFCLNRLSKMSQNDKLMLVISDGLPAHDGYGAEAGRKDCQAAVHEAIKNGITTITAGLGTDAPAIRSVYQEGRSKNDCAAFLDTSDISKMPKAFVKIIKERIKSA